MNYSKKIILSLQSEIAIKELIKKKRDYENWKIMGNTRFRAWRLILRKIKPTIEWLVLIVELVRELHK